MIAANGQNIVTDTGTAARDWAKSSTGSATGEVR